MHRRRGCPSRCQQEGGREPTATGVTQTGAKTVYPHITKALLVCSGRPCVQGTRVRVVAIMALHEEVLAEHHEREHRGP